MGGRSGMRWFKHLDFAALDVIVTVGAFLLSYYLRMGNLHGQGTGVYRASLYFIVMVAVILDLSFKFLKNVLKRGYLAELNKVFQFSTILVVLLALYQYLVKVGSMFSRQVFLTFWVLEIILLFAVHVAYKAILNKRLSDRANLPRLLLAVSDVRLAGAYEYFSEQAKNRYTIKAFAVVSSEDPDTILPKEIEGIPVLNGEDEMFDYIQHHVVDEVMLSIADIDKEKDMLDELMLTGMTVHVNLNRLFEGLNNPEIESFAGRMVLTTSVNTMTPVGRLFKRLMDIAGGFVGSIICLIALLIVGPIIKIQSPGPVFFTQERVGLNGRKFRIYKFRSMYADAEERLKDLMSQNKMQGLMFKMDNDPRITPIGAFIRKTSIDELPQFFNILKGDMSLVGTRPPTVREWEQYHLRHRARLAIKPGLTGLWQVSGRSDITDFDEVVSLDLQYIQNWSLKEDIKIILKTVWVVLAGRGAE